MQDVKDLALIIDSKVRFNRARHPRRSQCAPTVDARGDAATASTISVGRLTDGLNRLGFGGELKADADIESPTAVLRQIKSHTTPALFALCDFHPYLVNQPEHVRLLKDIAIAQERLGHTRWY